ncbi:MAG: prephenate dehydrogenase [Alistipes sp.]|nr:prephenate dehydrogenase [Alistipes sp.]MEE0915306.1 prephenate dehydrogenase [Alistipes sp.]
MRVAVIGLGLIGGSFALALKAKGIATTVVGVEANPQHAAMAIELGIVDSVMPLQEAVAEAELIAIAVPVDVIPQVAIKVLNRVTESQIVIDMGSTKEELCEMISLHPMRHRFVATHPMWGTEFSGPQAATADSFAGRNVVICEKSRSAAEAVERVETLYRALGMDILEMEAEQHDLHAAYVSHISHITSFILSTTVLEKEREEEAIFNLAGGGFDSTVRLAKSNADTWIPIFTQNKYNILDVLREYIHQLNLFRKALERDDTVALREIITRANDIRKVLQE